MDDAVMSQLVIPEDELSGDWREAMAQIARRTRESFRRHPWMLTHHDDNQGEGGPNGMRHFEQSLAAVAGTGLDAAARLELVGMVDDYIYGFAFREAAVADAGAFEDVPDAFFEYVQRLLDTGEYPHTAELAQGDMRTALTHIMRTMFDPDRFERGLQRLLDGIALDIERRTG